MQEYLMVSEGTEDKTRQYLANTANRKNEEDWFASQVCLRGAEARRKEPFFLVVNNYDPHEPWDPPEKYTRLYDPDGYEGETLLFPEYS